MDSIGYENEFVYTVHYSPEDSNTYIYSVEYIGGTVDSIELKVVSIPLDDPGYRDSFYVNAGWQPGSSCYEYFSRLSSILIFDVGSDGASEIAINWGFERVCDINHDFERFGYMLASDMEGNIVIDVIKIINTIECEKFGFAQRWYYVVWQNWVYWFSFGGYNEYYEGAGVFIYDDMLRLIDAEPVSYDWANFKLSKNPYGSFSDMLLVNDYKVVKYSAPFFFESTRHNMPSNALACYYKYENVQDILTGTQNSYFELRDMDLNLLAFIWGPPIEIFDADAVDIDLDGTDELLCKTESGFILYRLNTATAIAEGEEIQPTEFGIAAYPNPFNSEVNLKINGFDDDEVEFNIYDITGRLVKAFNTVTGAAKWDGRDYAGTRLSSGVYLVRAQSLEKIAIAKVLLLK